MASHFPSTHVRGTSLCGSNHCRLQGLCVRRATLCFGDPLSTRASWCWVLSRIRKGEYTSGLCCRPKVRVYYAAEGAFYLASVGMLLAWEERRRDFPVMALHHVTTCALIAASYHVGCGPCSLLERYGLTQHVMQLFTAAGLCHLPGYAVFVASTPGKAV